MSMIGNLVRLCDEAIGMLHADPDRIFDAIYPDDGGEPFEYPVDVADKADIDKSWHMIHFMLTGSDWEGEFPAGFLVANGKTVGEVDIGYGPARSFSSEETKSILQHLNGVSEAELRAGFKREDLARLNIYPNVWDDDSRVEEFRDEAEANLDEIKQFLEVTVERGWA